MAPKSLKSKDGMQQHARFLEAAREAGADVDTGAADRLIGKLAKTSPEPKPSKSVKAQKQLLKTPRSK